MYSILLLKKWKRFFCDQRRGFLRGSVWARSFRWTNNEFQIKSTERKGSASGPASGPLYCQITSIEIAGGAARGSFGAGSAASVGVTTTLGDQDPAAPSA